MPKRVNPTVLDQSLNYIKNNATQETANSSEPTTAFEGMDANVWAATTAYSLGTGVRPTVRNGFSYEATTAGTSAGTAPTFPTTAGSTVTDGTVVWTARANSCLSSVTMAAGDFTVANGTTGGNTPRKVSPAAKSAVTINTTGTATFVGLFSPGSPTVVPALYEITTCTSQALTSGNTLNFPTWNIEIQAPV